MKFALTIISALLLWSCEKGESENIINYSGCDCIDNNERFKPESIPDSENYQLTFSTDSRIHIYTYEDGISNANTEPGSNLVFQYLYVADDDSLIIDDEYAEILKFEIETGIDNFIISDDDLRQCNAVFGIFAFVPDGGYHRITGGCIKGFRMNEREWRISVPVRVKTSG